MIDGSIGVVRGMGSNTCVLTYPGREGFVIYGPYINLSPGRYAVDFELRMADNISADGTEVVRLDVCSGHGSVTHSVLSVNAEDLDQSYRIFRIDFELTSLAVVEFRVWACGIQKVDVKVHRELHSSERTIAFPKMIGDHVRWPAIDKSDKFSLSQAIVEADGAVPLFWLRSGPSQPLSNFGDALSPAIASALSGLPVTSVSSRHPVRLVSSGTIINYQEEGVAHIWGSGLDEGFDLFGNNDIYGYKKPNGLTLKVHAVRGQLTRKALLSRGVYCPPIFGDPGWLLPRIINKSSDIMYDIGVIPHISELDGMSLSEDASSSFARYLLPNDSSIKLISTWHDPSWDGLVRKIKEITSCRRIISASFHGLIVAQAYGIPAIHLGAMNHKFIMGNLSEDVDLIDHRVRDFMLGAGLKVIPVYSQDRGSLIDWDDVERVIDANCEPLNVDVDAFINAFPLPFKDRIDDAGWDVEAVGIPF